MRAPHLVVRSFYFYSFFLKIGQMVICPVRETYNLEANLTSVNSFNNICFKFKMDKRTQTRQFWGNIVNASTLSCCSLLILLLFLEICRIIIRPIRGTYNHVQIFLSSRMKKTLQNYHSSKIWNG